jgi:hypothetical protein
VSNGRAASWGLDQIVEMAQIQAVGSLLKGLFEAVSRALTVKAVTQSVIDKRNYYKIAPRETSLLSAMRIEKVVSKRIKGGQ